MVGAVKAVGSGVEATSASLSVSREQSLIDADQAKRIAGADIVLAYSPNMGDTLSAITIKTKSGEEIASVDLWTTGPSGYMKDEAKRTLRLAFEREIGNIVDAVVSCKPRVASVSIYRDRNDDYGQIASSVLSELVQKKFVSEGLHSKPE